MPNPVFEFLDGRSYTLNEISGQFRHETRRAIYPYPRTIEKLTFQPDEKGQATEEYRQTRRELKDDWTTDLTDAIDTYCDIAIELGFNDSGVE